MLEPQKMPPDTLTQGPANPERPECPFLSDTLGVCKPSPTIAVSNLAAEL